MQAPVAAQPPPAWPLRLWRAGCGALALAAVVWIIARGSLLLPISLFSAASTTAGFFTAGRILPLMAAAGALAAITPLLWARAELPRAPVALAFTLPLLAMAASTAHALYPHDARVDLACAVAVALLFVAVAGACGRGRGVLVALLSLDALGVWLALTGLAQWQAGRPTPVAWTGPLLAAAIPVRISATLGNPNVLGSALLLCLGGTLALAGGTDSRLLRAAALLSLLPMAAALPLTFSRAAYGGLAVLLAATLLGTPASRRRQALWAALCIALPVLLVTWRVPGVPVRLGELSPARAGDLISRLFTWRTAVSVLGTHPLLGTGPGGLEVLYAAHEPLGATGTYTLIDVPGSADSDVLQWVVESGLLGLAALLAALAVLTRAVWAGVRRRGPAAAAAAAALTGGLLAVGAQGLVESTAYVLPVAALLALTAAALVGTAGLMAPLPPAARALAAGTALAATAVGLFLWASWPAERLYAQGWAELLSGRPLQALPTLQAVAAAQPGNERASAAAGDAATQAARLQAGPPPPALLSTARTDLSRALVLDATDGDTWAAVASLLQLRGSLLGAACAEQAALRSFPYSPNFAQQLASALQAAGDPGAARLDTGYAAWLFPRQVAVYRELDATSTPYWAAATQAARADLAAWGGSPPPRRPALPLTRAACVPALEAGGLPGTPFITAMRGG